MPQDDAVRWNYRYQNNSSLVEKRPAKFLLENLHYLPPRGLALDVAMGSGRNANILVSRGLSVIGVDISVTAVHFAKVNNPGIAAVVMDLNSFQFPSHLFEIIINFYYLQRNLLKDFPRLLKPGGIVVMETLTHKMIEIHPETPKDYLLGKGELKQYFGREWQVIKYREGWIQAGFEKQKPVASIIARYKG
jgi:tellurite methyltransferase